MKNKLTLVIAAILLAAVLFIILKLISGTVHLVSGAMNAFLGIVIIIVLLLIVAWMFAYAKKKK